MCRNIAHLDIKPQNIVLMSEFPNCEIKLCDLEVSRVIQDSEQIRQIIGTPDYVGKIFYYGPGVYILRRNSFFRGLTELPYLEYVFTLFPNLVYLGT